MSVGHVAGHAIHAGIGVAGRTVQTFEYANIVTLEMGCQLFQFCFQRTQMAGVFFGFVLMSDVPDEMIYSQEFLLI